MTRFVALLRGIGPGNPNMRNDRLRDVCERLGLENVSTVISSGNVIFETDSTDVAELEGRLERAWPDQLGFESTTILRSRDQLEALVDSDPFEGREHTKETYLLTTFAKSRLDYSFELPHQPAGRDYWLVGGTDREMFSVTDTIHGSSLDIMAWMETTFGKEITSRTWLTVGRIVERMRT